MPRPTRLLRAAHVLLVTAVIIPLTRSHAQPLRYAASVGAGPTSWSGPLVQSGATNSSLGAAIEWQLRSAYALRLGVGAASASADLGTTGIFEEETTLTVSQLHLGAAVRAYRPARRRHRSLFVELGGERWRAGRCDVDMVGGPGFLGGSTENCRDWGSPFSDSSTGARRLRPLSGGFTAFAGTGAYVGRLGVAMQVRNMTPVVETDEGPIRAGRLLVLVEWVFNGRGRTAPTP